MNPITQITEETFEAILTSFIRSERIDLRTVAFIDPYGMLALLEIGELCQLEDVKKTILLPDSAEVCRYLDRMDFFAHARRNFFLEPDPGVSSQNAQRSTDSDVLLEITPIERSNDIHYIVGKVRDRAQAILETHLHYDERAINGFIVALSEVCQNIIEHSENKGFVGIQKYRFPNLNKNIVKIAVMDIGIGFRKSLSARFKLQKRSRGHRQGVASRRVPPRGRGQGTRPCRGPQVRHAMAGQDLDPLGHAHGSPSFPHGPGARSRSGGSLCSPVRQINIILPEFQADDRQPESMLVSVIH